MNENERINGYVAAVLTDESRTKLLEEYISPVFSERVIAHHMTVSFNPTVKDFQEKYEKWVGKPVKLKVVGEFFDEKAQAVVVVGFTSENKIPHITISLAPNVSAKYSNELLAKGDWRIIDQSFVLDAVVEKVPFSSPV